MFPCQREMIQGREKESLITNQIRFLRKQDRIGFKARTGGRSGLGQRRDTSSPGMGGGTEMRQGSESRHVGLNFSVR